VTDRVTDRAARVHTEHVRRLASLDPSVHLPDLDLSADHHEVLLAPDGEAVAVVEAQHTDPASTPGLWVDEDVHRVQVRCTAAAGPTALTELLARAATVLGGDRPAHLVVASRDLALPRPLLKAGYAPATVLALHRLEAPPLFADDATDDGVVVRSAVPDDVEAVVAASVAVQAHDSAVGVLPDRPGAAEVFWPSVETALRERPDWCWVAERAGLVVGVCEMEPPEVAEWVTGAVSPPPDGSTTAYLALLHVAAGERGKGVGAALVRTAHARAVEAGAGQVVLHHAATNPLSVPFWGRAGYRPLITGWARFPA
jgi:ribosomal protein S18 acetylase RimI-like enzyme